MFASIWSTTLTPFAQDDGISGVTKHLDGGFEGLCEPMLWLAPRKLHWTAKIQRSTALPSCKYRSTSLAPIPLSYSTVPAAEDRSCSEGFPGITRALEAYEDLGRYRRCACGVIATKSRFLGPSSGFARSVNGTQDRKGKLRYF